MERNSKTRRRLLKTVSGSIAAVGITSGISSAQQQSRSKSQFARIYDQAINILDRTGKQELFNEHFEKNGYVVQSEEITPSLNGEQIGSLFSERASVQREWPTNIFSWDVSFIKPIYGEDYALTVGWDWETVNCMAQTNDPEDVVGAYWSNRHFNNPIDVRFGDYVEYADRSPNGIAAKYDHEKQSWDNDPCPDGDIGAGPDRFGSYMSCRMNEASTNESDRDRGIIMEYEHTYEDVTINGISISNGGLSVTLSDEEHSWTEDERVDVTDTIDPGP